MALSIDDAEDWRFKAEFESYIEGCSPADFEDAKNRILDKLPQMHAATAFRLLMLAREKLLGQVPLFSRMTHSGHFVNVDCFHRSVK